VIADCHAKDNAIDDEWLIRDQGAIARQLGLHPKDLAAGQIKAQGGPEACTKPFTPEIDRPGPYAGTGNDNEWGARLAGILSGIMAGDFGTIRAEYDRAHHGEYPSGLTTHGWDGPETNWANLRSSFPNARFQIHHQIGRHDPVMPPRAAVRWSLDGTHDGLGTFGDPTGAPVHVMGITHAEFGTLGVAEPRLRREWTLYDETAIWKQILLHTGAA
jgi:predicted ester cyclase